MKLFKSKKKDGEKTSRHSLFGGRKKRESTKDPNSTDADSSSSPSQTDTTTTISPDWLNSTGTVNSRSNALAYHEDVLRGGDRSHTNPFSMGDENSEDGCISSNVNKDEGANKSFEEYSNARSSAFSESGSEGIDIGEMESSVDVLNNILTHLTEIEHREWAAGLDSSQKEDTPTERDDLDDFMRKAVDQMEIESQDMEVQRLGTQIVYRLSTLRQKNRIDSNENRIDSNEDASKCWYTTEENTSRNYDLSDEYEMDSEMDSITTDAMEAILQAMEDFPDDEELIENACMALEATTEMKSIESISKRILEEILMAIEGFADHPVVVSSSLGILYNISKPNRNDDLRRRLAKYALPSILQGMKEHRDDVELYTKGCKAMANFTRDDPNAQRILACKEALGLRIISEGLKYWEVEDLDEDAVVQHLHLRWAAIQVLKNLSTHSSLEVKGKIALGGGAARIVDRLLEALVFTGKDLIKNNYNVEDFSMNEGDQVDEEDEVGISLIIMRDSLQTIENLANIESVVTKDDPRSLHMPTIRTSAAVDNSSAEDIQRQLTKAVKPVLNTIRQHPNRRSLQLHSLSCIRQLTISHSDSISNHGGISTFLNLLSTSSVAAINDSLIHERALSCLTGLLSPSSNADGLDVVASMETEDGLDVIFRTIRRYQSNTSVIERAYESLFYLSCRVRVVLASIVGRHPSISSGLGAKAARKLQDQLCLEENIFVMLGTLNQYFETSDSISQLGLGLLVNVHAFLTQEEKEQNQQSDIVASDGGIRLVLAVMRRHGLTVAIQEYGVGLLAGILKNAINYNAIRCEFVDEEGISTVLAAMMIHPDHAAVHSHGCDVLVQLMTIDKHPMENGYSETAKFSAHYKKCILEETNAVTVVQDSMERFRNHKGVQHYGSALLQMLSVSSKAALISSNIRSSIISSIRP